MSVALAEAHARTASPIVLDIEASGFGRDSYPIEIGYVLPDGGSYCTLVRPEANWTHWDPEAQLSPSFHIENLRALLSESEAENWHTIKDQVSRELNLRRHRASSDARLLQMTLMRLRTATQPR